jgi:MYXO-CTERM domain-containing protein
MVRLSGFVLGIFLCGGCLQASTAWSIPAGSHDNDGALSGYVNFYLSDCVTGPTSSCTLNVAITNTQVNPKAAGQLISGLSFQLLNAGTSLPATGTLSDTINNNSNGDGTGGAVTVMNSNKTTTTTTTTPARWDFGTVAQMGQGVAGFDLTTLTGGKPYYMIMAAGPDNNANSSITTHSPTLMGTVDFEITNMVGLTTSTVLSNVNFYFGTGPDTHVAGVCTSGCGTISTTGATPPPPSVPEPFSFALAGSGLIGLAVLRRRRSA